MTVVEYELYVKWWWSGRIDAPKGTRIDFSEDFFNLPKKVRRKIQSTAKDEHKRLGLK
jgi:hypothetical protein